MRILGTIPNAHCRIQVFQNDGRFSVKIEKGLLEQLFKLRESSMINSFEAVQNLIDDAFIQNVLAVFELMQTNIDTQILTFAIKIQDENTQEWKKII